MTMEVDTGKWFKNNRENYQWPRNIGRIFAEQEIQKIMSNTRRALRANDPYLLRNALLDICRWKSNRTLSRYRKELASRGDEYLLDLSTAASDPSRERLNSVLRKLKIPYCNLPVSSAIASFIFGRNDVPVIDVFVAQFFAKQLCDTQIDNQTRIVLSSVPTIAFKLETYKKHSEKLRLAVYSEVSYRYNLQLYLEEFQPVCRRISDRLNDAGFRYRSIAGNEEQFQPIDVEMAIFTWGINNPRAF